MKYGSKYGKATQRWWKRAGDAAIRTLPAVADQQLQNKSAGRPGTQPRRWGPSRMARISALAAGTRLPTRRFMKVTQYLIWDPVRGSIVSLLPEKSERPDWSSVLT